MNLRKLTVVLLILTLLSGCRRAESRERAEFRRIRSELAAKETIVLRAEVTADYGERVYRYTLRYEGTAEGGMLTVEEPKDLSALTIGLSDQGVTLHCDGAVLDTGTIAGKLSPVEVFPLQLRSWQYGSILGSSREKRDGIDCTVTELELRCEGEEKPLVCRVWFPLGGTQPLFSELSRDGSAVLFCRYLK